MRQHSIVWYDVFQKPHQTAHLTKHILYKSDKYTEINARKVYYVPQCCGNVVTWAQVIQISLSKEEKT